MKPLSFILFIPGLQDHKPFLIAEILAYDLDTVSACSDIGRYDKRIVDEIQLRNDLVLENHLADAVDDLHAVMPRLDAIVRIVQRSAALYRYRVKNKTIRYTLHGE